jgi:flagellar hook-basal body complex protein FliE
VTSSDHAELSALATAIGDLSERVAEMAERFQTDDNRTDAATALFEAERSLHMGLRHVDRAVRALS